MKSALGRAMYGADAEWGRDTEVLAELVDLMAIGNWQRGGNPRATKPKAYRRPTFYRPAGQRGRDDEDNLDEPDEPEDEDDVADAADDEGQGDGDGGREDVDDAAD